MKCKWLWMALVAAVMLPACGGDSGPSAIHGTWVADMDALKSVIEEQVAKMEIPEEGRAMAVAGMTEAFNKLEVTMNADGTYNAVAPDGDKETGKWKLEGDKLTIDPDNENHDGPDSAVLKDGKLHMTGEGMPFTLVMKKK